jgi:hypothetical protein
MLCADLATHDQLLGVLGEPSAEEFLDLVSERPMLLVLLVTLVQQQPLLLADLLLHPATCPLACLIAADWTAQSVGSWSRALQDAENEEVRERAFADAMAIATQHLRTENVPNVTMTPAPLASRLPTRSKMVAKQRRWCSL